MHNHYFTKLLFVAGIILVSVSCSSTKSRSSDSNRQADSRPAVIDDGLWDPSLDTARSVTYLNEIEKNVVYETNKARSNPGKYAELYIEPLIKTYKGKTYKQGNITVLTKEGASALRECVRVMKKADPLPILYPEKGLSIAAARHAESQGKTNQWGHKGTDGSTAIERIKNEGTFRYAGENISYGCASAREILLQLLIDDGVKTRGHRINIMDANFTSLGVGYSPEHQVYGCECVIDYAGDWKDK